MKNLDRVLDITTVITLQNTCACVESPCRLFWDWILFVIFKFLLMDVDSFVIVGSLACFRCNLHLVLGVLLAVYYQVGKKNHSKYHHNEFLKGNWC